MGRKKLRECKRKRDFVKWARRRGARIKQGGRHTKICYDGYSVPVPDGEIRKGTRHSIIKSLVKIGLAVVFFGLAFAGGGYLALVIG